MQGAEVCKSSQKGIQSFQETFSIHTSLTIYPLLLLSNIGFIMKINVWICHQTWQIFIVLFVDFLLFIVATVQGEIIWLYNYLQFVYYYLYSLGIVEIINDNVNKGVIEIGGLIDLRYGYKFKINTALTIWVI